MTSALCRRPVFLGKIINPDLFDPFAQAEAPIRGQWWNPRPGQDLPVTVQKAEGGRRSADIDAQHHLALRQGCSLM